jgi:hypothetical protein
MTAATDTRSVEIERRSSDLLADKDVIPLGGRGAHLSALAVAVEQRREDVPPPSSLIA